ncbi:MAG: DNA polymerase III subunit beta [Proteobacteria bacterium]|nr:MAG: DNA polymerase III subunit beta [Pseudomonadota bacterium]
MTFSATVDQKPFAAAMAAAARLAARRTTIPILSHVILRGDAAGALAVSATDLEQALTQTVPCAAGAAGGVTAPAAPLAAFAAKADAGEPITLTMDGAMLTARQGRLRLRLPTLPLSDAPIFHDLPAGPDWEVDAAPFLERLKAIGAAASTEETRFYLNGVYLDLRQAPVMVATNGHILALDRLEDLTPPVGAPGVIIPNAAVTALPLVMAGQKRLDLRIGGERLAAQAHGLVFSTRLIDGRYPDYSRVIPADTPRAARVKKTALLRLLDRVSVIEEVDKESNNARIVRLTFSPGELTAGVKNRDGEESADACAAEVDGDEQRMGFNVAYLRAMAQSLSTASGDTLELRFSDALAPILLTVADDTPPRDRQRLRVIMPIRV